MYGRVEFVRAIGDELQSRQVLPVRRPQLRSPPHCRAARRSPHASRYAATPSASTAWSTATRSGGHQDQHRRHRHPEDPPAALRARSTAGAGGNAEDAAAAQRRPLHADPDQARRRPLRPQTPHRRARRGVTGRGTGPSRTRAALWRRQAFAPVWNELAFGDALTRQIKLRRHRPINWSTLGM